MAGDLDLPTSVRLLPYLNRLNYKGIRDKVVGEFSMGLALCRKHHLEDVLAAIGDTDASAIAGDVVSSAVYIVL
jgi:hypothetical protein